MSNNDSFERDPETLALFIEESVEALARIEKLLLAAERSEAPPDIMRSLFRDIHTIKGTSGFLALRKVLDLSHAAEDLLANLRDGTLEPKPAHFSRLVQVTDLLSRMIESVRATGDEGVVSVSELSAQLRQDVADGNTPEPAPPAAPKPTPAKPQTQAPATPAPEIHTPAATDGGRETAAREVTDGSVRVAVTVLDRLMNLMGELVLARNQMVQVVKTSRDGNGAAQAACQRLSLVTSELQEQIMKTRMQPVARVFEKIPRMVRDLCQATGKRVSCQIDGTATELDKALVEAVRDPVLHIIRNAVDHGFESPADREAAGKPAGGMLSVRASHEGGCVSIEIEDDGRGIDPKKLRDTAVRKGFLTAAEAARLSDREAIELVFRAGLSTAEKVTDISGRGVGMDVVRTHVERAGGQVELDSTVGKGTRVQLKMPLTLAIIPALLVSSGGQRFAIPQVNLLELVYLNEEQAKSAIEHVRGAQIYRLRGEILPLVRLSSVLGLATREGATNDGVNVVVVAVGSRRYGLLVDLIHDTEEIVQKPLHTSLKRLTCYSGATVLGDGGVALILEVAGVAAMAGIDAQTRRQAELRKTEAPAGAGPQPFLVFTAGDGVQCALPLALVARLEQVPSSKIERVAGSEVVQYRDALMPVIRPEDVLPIGGVARDTSEQQLVVFDFGQVVGMAVREIKDVVDLTIDADARSADPFTLGRTIVFGRATLLLDIYALVRKLAPAFVREQKKGKTTRRARVLVADDSNAMRAALTGFLQTSGFDVVDVSSGDQALREVRGSRSGPFDAVVTDLEMGGLDGYGLLAALHKEHPGIPTFVWTYQEDSQVSERAIRSGARACFHKLERERLMTALEAEGLRSPALQEMTS